MFRRVEGAWASRRAWVRLARSWPGIKARAHAGLYLQTFPRFPRVLSGGLNSDLILKLTLC